MNTVAPRVEIICADSLEHLRTLADESIDVVLTDPPYGLSATKPAHVVEAITRWVGGDRGYIPSGRGFMTESWDSFVPPPALWDECLRVLRPGGHLAAFAGARTQDLMGISIRLAGFEIRDGLAWIYGSGMPHGQNVAKAVESQILRGSSSSSSLKATEQAGDGRPYELRHRVNGKMSERTTVAQRKEYTPRLEEARAWEGWTTALKPAVEPIILARKPLAESSVAGNVLAHGTGALNTGATRIAHRSEADLAESTTKNQHASFGTAPGRNNVYGDYSMVASKDYDGTHGRHPANVLLTHSSSCELLGEKVVRSDSHHPASRPTGGIGSSGHSGQTGLKERSPGVERVPEWSCAPGCPVSELDAQSGAKGDIGGASRFFHTSTYDPVEDETPFLYSAKAGGKERPTYVHEDGAVVRHVSVKPLRVMRWLVRLLTPPGGVVLDPFAGSGTTVEAALLEGFDAIGIEREKTYLPLIHQRVERTNGLETS